MCGICGIVHIDSSRHISENEISQMMDPLINRGPDDEGIYIDNNVGLGFRRLSIIDLQTGHQPLSNEDESIWIIFNGEIYNFIELRQSLIKLGHTFKTKTDTETIVHLYEQYGQDCVNYLRGMFAFSIYDKKKQILFCARDRFGIKPFFYSINNNSFSFSSEIKSVLNNNKSLPINLVALDNYFTYGYINGNNSIYTEIQKLEPAHTLTFHISSGTIDIKKYWSIHFSPDYTISKNDWIEQLDAVLNESVKYRMISDVPLGAFLSGGIDSGSVVALMANNSNIPVKTFSIGFKEAEFNELQYAREISQKYNTEHHEYIVEPESVQLISKLVGYYDEPFADPSAIPTYHVSKFARQYVTVALSGDGGDELFAGYNSYSNLLKYYKLKYLSFGKKIWKNIYNIIPDKNYGKASAYFFSKNMNFIGAYNTLWNDYQRNKLYTKGFQKQLNGYFSESYRIDILQNAKTSDFISKLQYLDLNTYLANDILTKVDRASMMNSLEVRVPILDHKLAELSFNMPVHLKMNDTNKKIILKETMAKYLPESILNHKKQGFGVPLNYWFKNELKEYIQDTLINNNSGIFNYIDKKYVNNIIQAHLKGPKAYHRQLWSLLVFDEWLRQHQNNISG